MLRFDDERWKYLRGGYRTVFDPRPLLRKLESNINAKDTWDELWEELHHQGDVGEASYAAVPHLVRIYRDRGTDDWNTFAMVGIIELARGKGNNPDVPDWLKEDYFQAIQDLAKFGTVKLLDAESTEEIRTILCILALAKSARTHARFLLEYSEEGLVDLENRAFESHS